MKPFEKFCKEKGFGKRFAVFFIAASIVDIGLLLAGVILLGLTTFL